jgi:hypothetical protein
MKYIKLFEETENIKKYWLIKSPDPNYTAAALARIGMPKNNYWYNFPFRFINDVIFITHEKTSIWDGWGTKFIWEKDDLEKQGYEYGGEVIPTEDEIIATKYNL